MFDVYGYVDEKEMTMVIKNMLTGETQNTFIKLCSEDEVVEYSTNFIRACYRKYKEEQEDEE